MTLGVPQRPFWTSEVILPKLGRRMNTERFVAAEGHDAEYWFEARLRGFPNPGDEQHFAHWTSRLENRRSLDALQAKWAAFQMVSTLV